MCETFSSLLIDRARATGGRATSEQVALGGIRKRAEQASKSYSCGLCTNACLQVPVLTSNQRGTITWEFYDKINPLLQISLDHGIYHRNRTKEESEVPFVKYYLLLESKSYISKTIKHTITMLASS